jgi:hypothetical protein
MKTTSLSDQRHWRFQREQSREMREADWEYRAKPIISYGVELLRLMGIGLTVLVLFVGFVVMVGK